MSIYLPLLVAIIGLILYCVPANAKVSEIGRLAYFAGLLVTLLAFGHARLG